MMMMAKKDKVADEMATLMGKQSAVMSFRMRGDALKDLLNGESQRIMIRGIPFVIQRDAGEGQ